MSLSQKGAQYLGRDGLSSDPRQRQVLRAADDLASQIQAIRTQGNFGPTGKPLPPHPITAINVTNTGGFAQVSLTHANPPPGTRYIIEYSTTSDFRSPTQIDNGVSLTFQQYLHGQTLYFRAATMFPASGLSAWVYFGGTNNPASTTF